MKRALIACLLFSSLASVDRLRAQSPLEQLLLQSVGATSGQALYATYMAVNTLGDAWMAKAYDDNATLQMAGSYEGGIKAMMDNLNGVLENGKGLTPSDQTVVSGMVEGCQLITAQITALKGYVKTGEPAKAAIFETKRKEAQAKIFGLLGIDSSSSAPAGGGDGRLTFEILKSTAPDGSPGPLGKVDFVRPAEGKVFTASWSYKNGGTDRGIGVPYPESGVIAVGFGPDVLGVAIYKLNGKQVSARWANYAPGEEIGSYEMTQGADDSVFNIVGGGSVAMDFAKGRTAKVTWNLTVGTYTGLAVAEGDYLATVSIKPGGRGGVAIYTADLQNGTASGRWTMTGAVGAGEEVYKLISAGGAAAQGGPGIADPASEVKQIAQNLLDKGPSAINALRPTEEQISAIAATSEDATKLALYVDKLYNSLGEVTQLAKPGQTEIQVFTGADLPGGYTQQASHLKPGLVIYGFEFLEPGKTAGMSYDGVVNIAGKWVMVPKMWRAFAE